MDFDKVYRCWYARADKKIIGKYNSEKEAIEALDKYFSPKAEQDNLNADSKFSDIQMGKENKLSDDIKEPNLKSFKEKKMGSNVIKDNNFGLKDKQDILSYDLIENKRYIFLIDYI